MGRTQDLGGATDDATRTQNLTCSAFSLLASAATAHAECAWVVWQHDRYDYAKLERFGVYDSLAQCEEVARGEPELMQRSPGATVIVHKGALWRLTVLPDVFAYECWPDTVDPRGPKTR